MHSNGALRQHIPSGQVTTHVADHSASDLDGNSEGGGEGGDGGVPYLTSAHMAGTAIDGWQRKPLLTHQDSRDDDDDDDEVEQGSWQGQFQTGDGKEFGSGGRQEELLHDHRNGVVKINLPPPEKPKFPKEKLKTLLAFLFASANWFLTTVSLAIVHERLPDRSKVPPLPDVLFDVFPPLDWALDVSEILIVVSTNVCLLTMFLHRHRFIVLRRVFLILGLLYLMRCITMFVTQVPVASTTYFCSPKANSTSPAVVFQRVFQLMSGFGLSINGKHTYCGDYIYSGHTVILSMAYLVIYEYTPKRPLFFKILQWGSWLVSVTGVVMVLLARGHYTVDVLIAYYVTTRVFWMYHTMANNPRLKVPGNYNYLSRVWWFCMFEYFERNVEDVVPSQYDWPFPWPRRFAKRDRDS